MEKSLSNFEDLDDILHKRSNNEFVRALQDERAVFFTRKKRMYVFTLSTFLISSFCLYWFVLEPIGFGSRKLNSHSPVYFFVIVWAITTITSLIVTYFSARHATREYKKATYYYILQQEEIESEDAESSSKTKNET